MQPRMRRPAGPGTRGGDIGVALEGPKVGTFRLIAHRPELSVALRRSCPTVQPPWAALPAQRPLRFSLTRTSLSGLPSGP